MTTSLTTRLQPTIWQDATAEAQINDIIRKPFCPIARVVSKEVLADGRTCLIVCFPNCDRDVEEWVLPVTEVIAPVTASVPAVTRAPSKPAATNYTDIAPAIIPAPATVRKNDELSNCGDSGRERVETIVEKTDETLAAIFGERVKQYQQFLIVRKSLSAIDIKIGKLIASYDHVKGWELDWNNNKAGLFWAAGNSWEVSSLKRQTKLTGNWEDFDLIDYLNSKGIDLDKIPASTPAATGEDDAPPNRNDNRGKQIQPIIKTIALTDQATSERSPTLEEQRTDDIAKKFAEGWENWNVSDTGYFLKYKRPYALTRKQVDWLRSVYVKQFKWGESRDKAYERRSMDNMGSTYQREFMWQVSIHANGSGTFEVLVRK